MKKRLFLLSALLISAGFLIGVNSSLADGNTSVQLERLFPGQYDNTKYNIVISRPEPLSGINKFTVKKANGNIIYSGEPSCLKSVSSGAVTLLASDFPLSAIVNDCTKGISFHKITSLLVSTAVSAQKVILTPGHDHYFQATSGALTFGDISSGGITPSASWTIHADQLFVFKTGDNKPAWNDSASATYYFYNGQWRSQGAGMTEIPASTPVPAYFVIRRAANASTSTLTLPSNVVLSGSVPINHQPKPWDHAAGTYGQLTARLISVPFSAVNAGNQAATMARFNLDATGSIEDVKFTTLMSRLTYTGGKATDLTNCQIYDLSSTSGRTILNTGSKIINPTYASTANYNFVFDTPLVVSKGDIKLLELRCNISAGTATGASYSWGLPLYGVLEMTGVTSGAHITPTVNVNDSGYPVMINIGASLTVSKNAGFSGQNAVAGANDVKLGSIIITAGLANWASLAEGVAVNKIKITLDAAEFSSSVLTRMYLKDNATGTQLGESKYSLSPVNDYAVSFSLPAGGNKVIDIYGDIKSGANPMAWQAIVSAAGVGEVSGSVVLSNAIELQTINIISGGSLTATTGIMPDSALLIAGSNNNYVAQYTLSATGEGFTVNKLKLKVNDLFASSIGAVTVQFRDHSNSLIRDEDRVFVLGSSNLSGTAVATFTGLNMYVPKDGSVDVKVYVSLVSLASSGQSGSNGSISLSATDGFEATGDSGTGLTSFGSQDLTGNTFIIRKSKPTFAKLDAGNDPVNGPLYKFSVVADAAGNVDIKQLIFQVITEGVNVSGLYLYDPNTAAVLTDTPANINNGTSALLVGNYNDNKVLTISTTPKIYEVRGTVTGWGDGGAITIGIKQDTVAITDKSAIGIAITYGTGGYNTWSDRSAPAHTTATADWTNGYLLKDLTQKQSFIKSTTSTSSITVLSPNGGETIKIGEKYNIKWDLSNAFSTVSIKLKDESINCSAGMLGCQNVYGIGHNLPNTGSYTWDTIKKMSGGSTGPDSVALKQGKKYKIRICHSSPEVCDDSNNYFMVINAPSTPSITVLSPNGGEKWIVGETYTISYDFPSRTEARLIYLEKYHPADSAKAGKLNSSSLIIRPEKGATSISYKLPYDVLGWPGAGDTYKIKVCGDNECAVNDSSDNYFTIAAANTREINSQTSAEQIKEMIDKANLLASDKMGQILTELKQLRDQTKEQQMEIKYLRSLVKDLKEVAKEVKAAINNFITYGVDANTVKLGAGERAAVINSYKAAFGKLPETEAELADAIKIANGRWPSITNSAAEKKAKELFQNIYKRIPDMNDPRDNAAITVMAYGLRQKAANRNLNSEKAGIMIFKGIFGRTPRSTEDWNTTQAITYSGAAREKDSDGDLLADKLEAKLGTDPNNADSDGDGYSDGIEVLNDYNPRGAGEL